MPNLPAHLDLAHQAAERLGHRTLDAHIGYFLLGSTSPDVRVITHGRREQYHFAPLDFEAVGAGVKGLFDANPCLRATSNGHEPTRAFIAGYITHLVLDEAWITEMYRPCFGNPQVFENDVHGQVIDRALQLELDRLSQPGVERAAPLLAQVSDPVEVGFIDAATLVDWHQWVVEFMKREFTWDRLGHMARRIARGDDAHPAHGLADEFLRTMPASLDSLHTYVSPDALADFKDRSVQQLAGAVGDYLS